MEHGFVKTHGDLIGQRMDIFGCHMNCLLYTSTGKFENTPYPGIRELLVHMKNKGIPAMVATSKPIVTATEILDHFEMCIRDSLYPPPRISG